VGREQAEKVGLRLSKERVSAIYSSDLSRAYETAQIIANHHQLEIRQDPNLREINFGQWEGMSRQIFDGDHEDLYQKWLADPMGTRPPEGENFIEVQQRALRSLLAIAEKHQTEDVVVVAHGGLIKAVICAYIDGDFWEFPQGNTAVNILEFDRAGFRFIALNDLTHLEDDDATVNKK